MTTVTLLTDFGIKDGNVGVMKGVILGIAPHVQIVDLSHLVTPQNIFEASLILARSAPFFPDGTIHVVVVDPGVGTSRRPLAGQIGGHLVVGPDNGVFSQMMELASQRGRKIQFVHLDQPQYWLAEISHVFHGRDIFSPIAAHLASGVPLEQLGSWINDPVRLELPHPTKWNNGLCGQVIHIDHFGNIATNITAAHIDNQRVSRVTLNEEEIPGLVRTFGERPPGELVSLFGSTGNLLVCVVNGSAAERLHVKIGDVVNVLLE